MVRALLDGSKTQTRRVLRDQNPVDLGAAMHGTHLSRRSVFDKVAQTVVGTRLAVVRCPYGQPGDQIWVRENWQYANWTEDGYPWIGYQADGAEKLIEPIPSEWSERLFDIWAGLSETENLAIDSRAADRRWRSSIHMPRWASRITLEITGVRVERLQVISRGDAMAEGCPFPNMAQGDDPRKWYAELWESINGKSSWDANPWVWVIEFQRVTP